MIGELTIGRDWTPTVHGLQLRHDGLSHSANREKVGIEFRDLDEVDVRPHGMRGRPFAADETPLGQPHRSTDAWWRLGPETN